MKKAYTTLALLFIITATVFSQTSYYVNDNSTTGDVFTSSVGNDLNAGTAAAPFATIAKAYQTAVAGDIIYVDAGTYTTANISLSKSLTILGPNYNISPLDATRMEYNESRNPEAFINGSSLTIAASNIIIKGLVFDPGAKIQISKGNNSLSFSNITIAKNGFLVTSNQGAINLFGNGTSPSASANYTIDDNGFVQNGNSIVQMVTLNAMDAVTISNNSFLNGDGTPFTQTPIHLGANSLVSNITINNNVINEAFTGIFSNQISNILIENNKFYKGFNATAIRDAYSGSSNITLRGNYYQINRPTDALVVQLVGPSSAGTLKKIVLDGNTEDLNVTGFTTQSVTGYFYAQCNLGIVNAEYEARNNKINVTGTFGTFTTFQFHGGIRVNGKFNAVTVEENELVFNAGNWPAATSNSYGIALNLNTGSGNLPPPGSTINITNNKVSGYERAIQFLGGTLPGIICNANNNSLNAPDLFIANGVLTSPAMNATCNWYSTSSSQNIIPKLFTSGGALINYSPWLINGTDNELLTTGFQPVDGACNGTPPVITLNAANDISCFGANNGSVDITISGGSEPYLISWTKEGDGSFSSSSEDLTNLSPGTYDLTVTDANGSVVTLEVFIDEPLLLEATAGGTNNLCFGEVNGTASVLAGGGTAPYTYLWSNGATTDEIINLAAGVYTVTVTDANGCTATASYEVTQPTLLTASISNNSTACSNIATVTAGGGTPGYSYLWSNGSTSATISGVPVGTYTVTVTDANGCTATASINLTVAEAFNPSASVTHVSCFGTSTGVITVTNANGTAPFTFSIDGINFVPGTMPYSFTGLAAGTYTVAVRDVNGCTGFITKTINQPAQLLAVLTSVQSTCYGLSTGSISVTVTGGSGALSYNWTGPNGFTSTSKNLSSLATGNYSLVVTDANGCTAGLPAVVVPSFNPITINPVIINVSCKGGNNGSITLNTSGGTGNFSYLWNTGATTSSLSNLFAGSNYKVTITDIGSGCTLPQQTLVVTEPSSQLSLRIDSTVEVLGCNTPGKIYVSGSGGTAPYQFKLNNGSYQSSGTFTGLAGGSYTVWITDANGCTSSQIATVSDKGKDQYETCVPGKNNNNNKTNACTIALGTSVEARIGTSADIDYFKFVVSSPGSYNLTLAHPTDNYSFVLSTGTTNLSATSSTATTKTYMIATTGTYYVIVTPVTASDSSLICYQFSVTTASSSVSSGSKPQRETDVLTGNERFAINAFPNPSGSYFNLKVETGSNEKMSLRVVDISGRIIEERQNLQPQQIIRLGDRYLNGVYIAEIIQGANRKAIRLVKM